MESVCHGVNTERVPSRSTSEDPEGSADCADPCTGRLELAWDRTQDAPQTLTRSDPEARPASPLVRGWPVAEPAGIEDIEVAHVPEPEQPEEGLIDSADIYTEGASRMAHGHGLLPEADPSGYGPDAVPLEGGAA